MKRRVISVIYFEPLDPNSQQQKNNINKKLNRFHWGLNRWNNTLYHSPLQIFSRFYSVPSCCNPLSTPHSKSSSTETVEVKSSQDPAPRRKQKTSKTQPVCVPSNVIKPSFVQSPISCPIEYITKDFTICNFYPSLILPSFTNIRISPSHLSSINFRTRIPDWVSERITFAGIHGIGDRSSSTFFIDHSVPDLWRSTNEDFRYSGYDRGHLAPAGSHRNDQVRLSLIFCSLTEFAHSPLNSIALYNFYP